MAESFSDQSGDVFPCVTQVTGKEPIQAESQPHSPVQGNIIGVGGDIALSKEGTSEVRFTISEEEEEEGSIPFLQGTIKLIDDISRDYSSEKEKELLRIAKETLKELLELQRKGTTDC